MIEELCQHVRQRLPGRLHFLIIHTVVNKVVNRWRYALRDEQGLVVAGLRADAHRAALAWLRDHGEIRASGQEYDDLLAETVLGGGFDAAAIRAGIDTWVRQRRVTETLILIQYLDLAETNGSAPSAQQVLHRLRERGRTLTPHDVHEALLSFHHLLQGQGGPPCPAPTR
ncbi:hypothetical protein ACTOB_002203 [Actinoplanes oblitus]|uniref:Bacterial transcriptional activator domain-containing protein n=1 Tax=Actinoplanes oblitus TaxID=3040509 RepID=A0ABY8WL64_9ACTN|nr:hypothetical protein [Actinoplanes oblitus]WIM98599.1 hypothetical protein ACTOB_002203 [Actinoplanes oblitus]